MELVGKRKMMCVLPLDGGEHFLLWVVHEKLEADMMSV